MIETFYIKETDDTPLINLDYNDSVMMIKGVLIPEDAVSFFKPIFDWLELYRLEPIENGCFLFEFDYFNTISSVMLLKMMRIITKIPSQTILWVLNPEDGDMLEVVNDYNELLGGIIVINMMEEK